MAEEGQQDRLVARARDGDTAAFASLVERNQDAAFRVALRIVGDPRDAEDIAQDAFVAAWSNLDRFREEASFATWLYRIVVNRGLDLVRTRPLTVPMSPHHEPQTREPGPEQVTLGRDDLQAVRAVIGRLEPTLRAPWVLRELEELDYARIAEILDLTPGAVRVRVHRARVRIVELLGGER